MVTFGAKFVCFCKNDSVFNDWLLADPLKTPLNWRTRLQIAIGVAAALVSSKFMRLSSYKAHN